MNTSEQIRVIAEYDGWRLKPISTAGSPKTKRWFHPTLKGLGGRLSLMEHKLDSMPYLTDLNYLHKVAMRVLDELEAYIDNPKTTNYRTGIYFGCRQKPNAQGEYTDLLQATYNGITYLNNLKEQNGN
jgi:hypothetical protein